MTTLKEHEPDWSYQQFVVMATTEPDCSRCMSKVWNAKGVLFETEEDRPSSLCVVMKGTTCNVEQVLVGSVR